jgi:ActR/RegA family two-component response regulator
MELNMNKVCIVEDENIIARDLEFSLKLNGYNVCSIVNNIDDALYVAKCLQPRYFLMDINLGGNIDGIKIAE